MIINVPRELLPNAPDRYVYRKPVESPMRLSEWVDIRIDSVFDKLTFRFTHTFHAVPNVLCRATESENIVEVQTSVEAWSESRDSVINEVLRKIGRP